MAVDYSYYRYCRTVRCSRPFLLSPEFFVGFVGLHSVDEHQTRFDRLLRFAARKPERRGGYAVEPHRRHGDKEIPGVLLPLAERVKRRVGYSQCGAAGGKQVVQQILPDGLQTDEEGAAFVGEDIAERFAFDRKPHQRAEIVAMGQGRKRVFFEPQQAQRMVGGILHEISVKVVYAVKSRNKDGHHPFGVRIAAAVKRGDVGVLFTFDPREHRSLVQIEKRRVGQHPAVGAALLEIARMGKQTFIIGHVGVPPVLFVAEQMLHRFGKERLKRRFLRGKARFVCFQHIVAKHLCAEKTQSSDRAQGSHQSRCDIKALRFSLKSKPAGRTG